MWHDGGTLLVEASWAAHRRDGDEFGITMYGMDAGAELIVDNYAPKGDLQVFADDGGEAVATRVPVKHGRAHKAVTPGSADLAHYLLKIPKDVKGTVHLEARLNYRKFTRFYTEFTYEGKEAVPTLPVIEMASATAELCVGKEGPKVALMPIDAERWNDYGIGLFRQGDFTGAIRAFRKVTELNPGYPDGWVNVGACSDRRRRNSRGAKVARQGAAAQSRSRTRTFFPCLGTQGRWRL